MSCFAICICSFLITSICAENETNSWSSEEIRGVDDWGMADVEDFFKDSGIQLKVADLQIIKDGYGLMLLDEQNLADLGLTEIERHRIVTKLVKMREGIDEDPLHFFEWRVAHLRVIDFWMCPLLSISPRAGLIWARFFSSSYSAKISRDIDEISTWRFWIEWLIVPCYPVFRTVRNFHSDLYLDELLKIEFLSWSLFQLSSCYLQSKKLLEMDHSAAAETVVLIIKSEVLNILGSAGTAMLAYHVLYWITPSFAIWWFFYLTVCVIIPLRLFRTAMAIIPGLLAQIRDLQAYASRLREARKKQI